MAKLTDIVFDSFDPPRLARFWASVLDDYEIRPYTKKDIEDLAQRGLTPSSDPNVALDGTGPTIFFQKSSQPKTERNRVHLDIRAEDRKKEVARLQELGGRIRNMHDDFTVMLDPEGNEFCVVDLDSEDDAQQD